jgi:hypothetical protein
MAKSTPAKKTAADKRMDTVLRKLLATPPQPHGEDAPKRPKKQASSHTRRKAE